VDLEPATAIEDASIGWQSIHACARPAAVLPKGSWQHGTWCRDEFSNIGVGGSSNPATHLQKSLNDRLQPGNGHKYREGPLPLP
jgi:hypothetical protein